MNSTRVAAPMDPTAGDLQGSEQTGGAVAHVVMAHAGGQTRPLRLGAIERLDLRLFLNAEHDGPRRRIHIKPDDIRQLGGKLRVGAEGLHPVRLQPSTSARCGARWRGANPLGALTGARSSALRSWVLAASR